MQKDTESSADELGVNGQHAGKYGAYVIRIYDKNPQPAKEITSLMSTSRWIPFLKTTHARGFTLAQTIDAV